MSFKTASAILRGKWLIDKHWANAHMPVVVKMIKGETVDFGLTQKDQATEATRVTTKMGVVYSIGYYTDVNKLPEGTIAMVNIIGPVTKYGDYCAYGSVDHVATISRLANASNVAGILLNVDSPGGEASGTAMLADTIKAAAQIKPVIGLVDDGIAASAAMWIISACTEIYASQKTDGLGSIGAYQTIADWYAYFESEGLKVRDIYAPQSTEKNLDYREALDNNDDLVKADLKLLVDEFIGAVRNNRSGKLTSDEWTTGKMFSTKEALRIGLIDGQKTFNQVIKRMDQLIQNKSKNSNSVNMAFTKTLTAAKAHAFEVTDGGFLLQEDQLNNIEAVIDQHEANATAAAETAAILATENANQIAAVQTSLDTATVTATQASADLATANTRIAELEAEVATLSKEDGTEGAGAGAKEKDAFANTAQAAMEMPFQKELLNKL